MGSDRAGHSLRRAVAFSPLPIIAVVLILATPNGPVNGLAFLLGSVVGLCAVGGLVLVAVNGGDASNGDGTTDWVSVVKIVLGERATGWLGEVRDWMARENSAIIAVIARSSGQADRDAISALTG